VSEKRIMPLVSRELAMSIMKTGYALILGTTYELPESMIKRRESQGLPPLPVPNANARAELEKIYQVTGSTKLIDKVRTFEQVRS
jgi:hypothetical protein